MYLHKARFEFDFSNKLYLAQYEQIFLSTPHLISPESCKYTVGNVYTTLVK